MTVSDDTFRRVMRRWGTGVTVVTVRHGNEVRAILVTSFLSVSIDPPTVLVSIRRGGETHRLLEAGKVFAVNLLNDGQADLAHRLGYAGDETLRSLRGVAHHFGTTGAPIFDDSMAWLDCRVIDQHETKDHTLYIGLVEAGDEIDSHPLVHWERRFWRLDTVHTLTTSD